MRGGERVEEVVGYQLSMDHKLPREQGSIQYCTTGILLQRMQSDRTTQAICQGDIMADLIQVIIKKILPARRDLRVLLMSATLNATLL
jgi:ATP-dependent RNA helicase DHX36